MEKVVWGGELHQALVIRHFRELPDMGGASICRKE
jgi:hypothetical protein